MTSCNVSRTCRCGAALPGRCRDGGWGGGWEPVEKVGRGIVEHVEEGPRPNLIRRSNSSEKVSISRGSSGKGED